MFKDPNAWLQATIPPHQQMLLNAGSEVSRSLIVSKFCNARARLSIAHQ